MKVSKISAGLAVAFLGTIGAVTAAKSYAPNTYYYQTGSGTNPCTDITVNFDCSTGGSTCTGPENTAAEGLTLFLSQNATSGVCETPLKRP
jgi:hypothetical protein